MSSDIEFKLDDNFKKLGQMMAHLPDDILRKSAIGILRVAARPILKAARAKAPVKTGGLRKSLRLKVKKAKIPIVKVIAGKGGAHANMVEFGTKPHIISAKDGGVLRLHGGRVVTSVSHPGSKKHPFMRPAFLENTNKALEKIGTGSYKVIEKQLIKALK